MCIVYPNSVIKFSEGSLDQKRFKTNAVEQYLGTLYYVDSEIALGSNGVPNYSTLWPQCPNKTLFNKANLGYRSYLFNPGKWGILVSNGKTLEVFQLLSSLFIHSPSFL